MTTLAIDRFRARGVAPDIEARAQEIASAMRGVRDPALLLGYLEASVAVALERPRLANRDRLAIDLRVVEILWDRKTP